MARRQVVYGRPGSIAHHLETAHAARLQSFRQDQGGFQKKSSISIYGPDGARSPRNSEPVWLFSRSRPVTDSEIV